LVGFYKTLECCRVHKIFTSHQFIPYYWSINIFQILRQPSVFFRKHKTAVLLSLLVILSATIYPSDMENDYSDPRGGQASKLVMSTEEYGRHINTLLPVAAIMLLRDWTGLKQLAVVTVAGMAASHGPKRLLNDVTVMGTRLGQRPRSPNSKHNMPSGHATLASAGAYFTMRRYSFWLGLIVIPVMLLTMYARVMLDAHTISAVISGAMTGTLVTALFATKWRGTFVLFTRKPAAVKKQADSSSAK
jgi:membrane-associated phospholipid phosphatase